ncbi:MAG: hypothetical protein WC663_02410 [Patescibacteria group bacterium]|jgi:hypothetical protein
MPNPEQPMKENIADIKEPQQHNVEGLEIAKTPESERVIESANNLAGKIERDEKVAAGEVYDLREALGQMKFDVGGEMMTKEQIKQIPDLQENLKIMKEIKARDCRRAKQLTFLTQKTIENLGKLVYNFHLDGITFLTDTTAESLSHHHGDLYLLNLTSLSDAAAESLSHHQAALFFNRLSSLSDAAAESLSRHSGLLGLNNSNLKRQIDKFKTKK